VNALAATVALYLKVSARAAELVARNWMVLATVLVYAVILSGASAALALTAVGGPFFALGSGLLMTLIRAACIGSFLYLVEMMIRTSRVNLTDFRRSFGVYLWDVIGVSFVLWIFFRLIGPLIAASPLGPRIMVAIQIALVVFLNAVPELIYLGHYSTLALLGESYRFISENWIEWFPPNFVLLAVLYLVFLPQTDGVLWLLLQATVAALAVYFFMVLRGLLFLELSGSSRRSRTFRYRMGQS